MGKKILRRALQVTIMWPVAVIGLDLLNALLRVAKGENFFLCVTCLCSRCSGVYASAVIVLLIFLVLIVIGEIWTAAVKRHNQ
jgi:hypothetical protein